VPPKEVTTLEELKQLLHKHSIKTLYCLFEDKKVIAREFSAITVIFDYAIKLMSIAS
jgi:hypothetical protein